MNGIMLRGLLLAATLFAPIAASAQTQIVCPNGQCPLVSQPAYMTPIAPPISHVEVPCKVLELTLSPLSAADADDIDLQKCHAVELGNTGDRMQRVIAATVRVTVSGVCGSGTVVGRDGSGNAIVLTNAHVAGTQKGRVVQLQRWNADGSSERGQGAIIAAGYGRGLSVDFALLKCNAEFAKDVSPIPLADRYPDKAAGVTTYGCPRCEWPSLQVLRMNRNEGQVLRWHPEAIGGRSGSSLVDYTESGPRVVGLLTWGGGGEGLGQSTPFLLDAMRGRLPKSFEALPDYASEVSYSTMPCTTDGRMLAMNQLTAADETLAETDADVIDSILESGPDEPDGGDDSGLFRDREPREPREPGPIGKLSEWFRRVLVTLAIAAGAAAVGYIIGRMR